jgi:hypothetical protein
VDEWTTDLRLVLVPIAAALTMGGGVWFDVAAHEEGRDLGKARSA